MQSSRYNQHSRNQAMSQSSEPPETHHETKERHNPAPAIPIAVPATPIDPAAEKFQKELEDIKQMMKALIPTTTSRRECKTKMPFTDRLDAVPLPKGFVFPQFTQFSGTGDPIKYLQGLLAKMEITSNNPDIYAKAFSNSSGDKALDWYMALPLKSIDSYQQTADAFIAKFGSVIQKHQDERALMDIEQGPNESLRTEVFSQIEDKNLLPKPVRMRSAPSRRDKNRYCEDHCEHGHDTNECRILKSELEKLIKRGYLKEFVESRL
ncbi:hypothetical protein LIER_13287 [Lithospermum erythrorhizon]|uniref:Retrotransposon gag domain-containing protein n=1 Tax=Lithospermum erythrorhizon TaxID=34254 RepID=A0AAV3PWV9_LITER